MAERADESFLDALADVAAALGSSDAPSMIIGGIAVIARGVPRHTIDIDATVVREFALALDDPERVDQLEALITRARRADHEI